VIQTSVHYALVKSSTKREGSSPFFKPLEDRVDRRERLQFDVGLDLAIGCELQTFGPVTTLASYLYALPEGGQRGCGERRTMRTGTIAFLINAAGSSCRRQPETADGRSS
jgi:hypothetical protein